MRLVAAQSAADRRRLLELLQRMADHPVVRTDDLPRRDLNGRTLWLRFADGFAVIFWHDHSSKELRVLDIGFE